MKMNQNYFELVMGGSVGLLFNEKMMRRLVKIECQFLDKIKDVIANNLDDCCVYSWTGVKTHKDGNEEAFNFPTCYYIDENNTPESKLERMERFHLLNQNIVRRANPVFKVKGTSSISRQQCQREFIKFLEDRGDIVFEEEKKECGYNVEEDFV